MSDVILVAQVVATLYLMYKQNTHLAEANRIARERRGARVAVAAGWPQALRHYWPLIAMGVLAVASWVPRFLPNQAPSDIFMGYGWNGSRIYATLRTSELLGEKPKRVMIIARVVDNSINYESDPDIAKSATFEILDPSTGIEVTPPPSFHDKPGPVDIYAFLVSEQFPFERVKTIADAKRLGAKLLGAHGFSGGTVPGRP